MPEQEIDFNLLLEETLKSMITVSVCGDCGWIIDHPTVRWCANCGGVLIREEITTRELLDRTHRFHQETGWGWTDARFNPNTGKPILPEE